MKDLVFTPLSLDHIEEALRKVVREELEKQEKQQHGDKLLSPKEACKLFKPAISLPTLSNWSQPNGPLPKHKLGGRVFYKESEVLAATTIVKKYRRAVI